MNVSSLPRFITVTEAAIEMNDLIILCYNVNDPKSIDPIRKWLHRLKEKFSVRIPNLALVGTKGDLSHNVISEDLEVLKNEENVAFDIITSAKKMENIEELIEKIVNFCHNK